MIVSRSVYGRMISESERAVPREAVGLIFGNSGRANRFVGLTNVSMDDNRFSLEESEVSRVLSGEPEDPIGFFHSHPTDISAPSVEDILGAEAWPECRHFILSLRENKKLTCWTIFDGQALPDPVEFADEDGD